MDECFFCTGTRRFASFCAVLRRSAQFYAVMRRCVKESIFYWEQTLKSRMSSHFNAVQRRFAQA